MVGYSSSRLMKMCALSDGLVAGMPPSGSKTMIRSRDMFPVAAVIP